MDHTASVVSYLMEIYHSVAETLPDFRDETLDVETSLVAGDGEDKDFYSDLLAAQQALGPGPENPKSSSSSKPKNPKHRKMRKSIKVNLARKPETGGLYEDKWLPPGQMKDHWELYRRCQRGHECASFSTFWRAPWSLFVFMGDRCCFMMESYGINFNAEYHVSILLSIYSSNYQSLFLL